MFEYFADAIMSINIMGIGAYPLLLSISIGIALLISQKRIGEFILITAILNLIIGIGLYMASQQGMYLVITAIGNAGYTISTQTLTTGTNSPQINFTLNSTTTPVNIIIYKNGIIVTDPQFNYIPTGILGNITALSANVTNVNSTAALKINQSTHDALYNYVYSLSNGTSNLTSYTQNYTTQIGFNNTGSTFQLNLKQTSQSNLTSTFIANDTTRALAANCTGVQVLQNISPTGGTCVTLTAAADGNNYTTQVGFNNTGSTFQINLQILGRDNLTSTFIANDTTRALAANCTGNQFLQNITPTSGACVTPAAGAETDPIWTSNYTGVWANISWASANISSIGNWSSDKSGVGNNISNVNSTANLKALPGTCQGQSATQNTTTSGVQCVGFGISNLSTSDVVSAVGNWTQNGTGVWGNITWAAGNISSIGNWSNDKSGIGNNISNANETAKLRINQSSFDALYNYAHSLSNGSSNLTSYTQNYTTQIGFNNTGSTFQLNLQQTSQSNLTSTFIANDTTRALSANCTGNTFLQNVTPTGGICATPAAGSETDPIWTANNTGVWANISWAGANATSLGNWSADKTNIQNNISNVNSTANLKSLPGTCQGQTATQNTTTSGVQCVGFGTSNISYSDIVTAVGNWTQNGTGVWGNITLAATNISSVNGSALKSGYINLTGSTCVQNLSLLTTGFSYSSITTLTSESIWISNYSGINGNISAAANNISSLNDSITGIKGNLTTAASNISWLNTSKLGNISINLTGSLCIQNLSLYTTGGSYSSITALTSETIWIANYTGISGNITAASSNISWLNTTKIQNSTTANLTSLWVQNNVTSVHCITFDNGARMGNCG